MSQDLGQNNHDDEVIKHSKFSRSIALIMSVVLLATGIIVWSGIDHDKRNAADRDTQSAAGYITPEKDAKVSDKDLLHAMGGAEKASVTSEKTVPGLNKAAEVNAVNRTAVKNEKSGLGILELGDTYTIFDKGDGKRLLESYTADIRYRDADGKLHDYDNALVPVEKGDKAGEEYALTNARGAINTYLPANINEQEIKVTAGTADSQPFVMKPLVPGVTATAEKGSTAIKKTSFAAPAPDASGSAEKESAKTDDSSNIDISGDALIVKKENENLYGELSERAASVVYPYEDEKGIYFEYMPTDRGVKETIILTRKPDMNSFRFAVSQEGCRAELSENAGSIHFIDTKSGEERGVITMPYMLDSSEDGAYNDTDLKYSIEEDPGNAGGYIVTLTVSRSYLDDPERVYPITIDPTYTKSGSSASEDTVRDVYVLSKSPYHKINFWDSGILKMITGYNSGDGTGRTILWFPGLTNTVKGAYINSATFALTEISNSSPYCSVQVCKNTTTYTTASVTWDTRPSYTSTPIASAANTGKAKHSYDITSLIRGHASGSYPDYGVVLRAASESSRVNNRDNMYNARAASASKRPSISVSYTVPSSTAPAAPTVTLGNANLTSDANTTLSWSGLTTNILANMQYQVNYQTVTDQGVHSASGSVYRAYTNLGAAASGTVTLDTANWPEGCYTISVRAVDKFGKTGTARTVTLHKDLTPPTIEATIDGTETGGYYKTPPTLGFSGYADKHASGVEYSLNGSPWTEVTKAASAAIDYPPSLLTDGENTFTVRGKGSAGETPAEKTITFLYDDDAPTIDSLTARYSANSLKFIGWTDDGNPELKISGLKAKTAEVTASGIHYAIVPEGSSAPAASEYKKADSAAITGSLTGEEGANATFRLRPEDRTLASGRYLIYVKAVSAAGNESVPVSSAHNLYAGKMDIEVSALHDEADIQKTLGIYMGDITVNIKNLTPYCLINGGKVELKNAAGGQVKELGSGIHGMLSEPWDIDFDTKSVKNGTYTLSFTGTDMLGNAITGSAPLTIDNKPEFPATFRLDKRYGTGQNVTVTYDWGKERPAHFTGFAWKAKAGTWHKFGAGETSGTETISLSDLAAPSGAAAPAAGSLADGAYTIAVKSVYETDLKAPAESERVLTYSYYQKLPTQTADSALEAYKPEKLTASETRNFKQVITWEVKKDLPADITYSVYRDGYKDFIPAKTTLVAEGLKTGYFTDMSVGDSGQYYTVRAEKTQSGGDAVFSTASTVSADKSADVSVLIKASAPQANRGTSSFTMPNADMKIDRFTGSVTYSKKDISLSKAVFTPNIERTYNSAFPIMTEFGKGTDHSLNYALMSVSDGDNTPLYALKESGGTVTLLDKKVSGSTFRPRGKSPMLLTKENLTHTVAYAGEKNGPSVTSAAMKPAAVSKAVAGTATGAPAVSDKDSAAGVNSKTAKPVADSAVNKETTSGSSAASEKDSAADTDAETEKAAADSATGEESTLGESAASEKDSDKDSAADTDSNAEKPAAGSEPKVGSEPVASEKDSAAGAVTIPKERPRTIQSAYTLKYSDTLTMYFNEQGEILLEKDDTNNFMVFIRDEKTGRLAKVINNADEELVFEYGGKESPAEYITRVNLRDGSALSYGYDKDGRITSQEHISAKTGDDAIKVTYAYDDEGRLTALTDALNNKYTLSYKDGKVSEARYPSGENLHFTYAGNKVTEIKKSGDTLVSTQSAEYNERGQMLSQTEPNGRVTTYEYDGDLLKSTTVTSQRVTYENGVITVSGADKFTSVTVYDGKGNVISENDEESGTVTTHEYNSLGEPTREITTTGKGADRIVMTKVYNYKALSGKAGVNGENKRTTSVDTTSYAGSDVKDEISTSEQTEDGLGNAIESEKTDENNIHTEEQTTYDEHANKTATSSSVGKDSTAEKKTEKVYDNMNRLISERTYTLLADRTKENVIKTEHIYDGFGREIQTSVTCGDEKSSEASQKTYNANGSVVTETDKKGVITTNTYDTMNKVVSTSVSRGKEDAVTTTEEGYEDIEVLTHTGKTTVPNAHKTVTATADGTKSIQYQDTQGNIIKTIDKGQVTDTEYSLGGKTICEISYPEGSASLEDADITANAYDMRGNQVAVIVRPQLSGGQFTTAKESVTTFSAYDKQGNKISQTDALGRTTKMEYRGGKLFRVILPDPSTGAAGIGPVTEYRHISASESVTGGAPREYSEDVTVDALGRYSAVRLDNKGQTTSTGDYGTSRSDSTQIVTTSEYTESGKLSKQIFQNGDYQLYTYDGKDRVANVKGYKKAKSGADTLQLETATSYDSDDNAVSVLDKKDGAVIRHTRYEYDAYGRRTASGESETEMTGDIPAEKKYTYTYDVSDRVTGIGYPAGYADSVTGVGYRYDSLGRISLIKAKVGGSERTAREYRYDAKGRVSQLKDSYDFGVKTAASGILIKSYTYDDFGRVTLMTSAKSLAPDTVLESYAYRYDKNGQITQQTIINDLPPDDEDKKNETRDFTYDALGRLTQASFRDNRAENAEPRIKSYSYDAAGNRTGETEDGVAVTSAFNEFNQLTAKKNASGAVAAQYAYDANGNQVSETRGQVVTANEYDVLNRLTKTTLRSGTAVQKVTENAYNGDSQRIRKNVTTGSGASAAANVTNYFYQDSTVGYTTGSAGGRTSLNILSPEGAVISSERYDAAHAGKLYLYTKDQQGSTMNLIDDKGIFAKAYVYDDFGQTTSFGDSALTNEICYTGGIYDESTGQYYLNARYYDPNNGRFITMDTYRGEEDDPQTLHLYAYCANNPVNFTDPSGHKYAKVIYYSHSKRGFQKQAYNSFKYKNKNASFTGVLSTGDFVKAWNSIIARNVYDIFLYLHGGTGELYFYGQTASAFTLDNRLAPKSISGRVYLYSCHGAGGRNSNNIAYVLAKKTKAWVWASTGAVGYTKIFGKYFARIGWDSNDRYRVGSFGWYRYSNGRLVQRIGLRH